MNYRLNRRRVPQGVVDQAFVNRAPHAGAQNSANRAAQRLGDFCLRTPIFIEPQDAIAIEGKARPAADVAFAPGARQPGTAPPAPQPAEPETEDQRHARLLSGFLFGADDTRMIRGRFVSGRRPRALAAAQVMPMPCTVMSISAPSPGARLGELAAIARAEAAIGDTMRYQKPRVGPALIWVYGFARGLETSSSGGAGGEASRSSSRRGASLFAGEIPRRGGIDWNGFQVRHLGSGRACAVRPVAASGDKPSRTAPEGPGAAECVSDKSSALLSAGMPSRPLETAPGPSGELP